MLLKMWLKIYSRRACDHRTSPAGDPRNRRVNCSPPWPVLSKATAHKSDEMSKMSMAGKKCRTEWAPFPRMVTVAGAWVRRTLAASLARGPHRAILPTAKASVLPLIQVKKH